VKLDQNTAIFFDAGHTLLYPKVSVGAVYADIARQFGVISSADQLDDGFRSAWKQMKIAAADEPQRDDKQWWKKVVHCSWSGFGPLEQLPFDDYFEIVYSEFARPERWSVYPDVRKILAWICDRNIRCGIISNWDERLRPVLVGHSLLEYFDPIIISAEQGESKPSPKIFRIAESQTGAGVDSYWLVGDDIECDQCGAESVGWNFFHVNRPHQNLEDLLKLLKHAYKD